MKFIRPVFLFTDFNEKEQKVYLDSLWRSFRGQS
jgi:hypothetical protein